MKIDAEWTDDCQGKKDFDGQIVSISTRYWSRGGGFGEYNSATGEWRQNADRPHIKPSAHATILIRGQGGDEIDLVDYKVEGETEEEVKAGGGAQPTARATRGGSRPGAGRPALRAKDRLGAAVPVRLGKALAARLGRYMAAREVTRAEALRDLIDAGLGKAGY